MYLSKEQAQLRIAEPSRMNGNAVFVDGFSLGGRIA